jgi:hypothetical protein
MTERVCHRLTFRFEWLLEVTEDGDLVFQLTDDQLRRWLPAVQAGLAGLEPVAAPVTGSG